MEAATLNCPMCGASAATDSTCCEHCQARLATVACPSCFGMLFLGSKFCPHCGARAARDSVADESQRQCPTCRIDLQPVALSTSNVHECGQCAGLWVDVETFQQVCADREQQAAVLGGATPDPLSAAPTVQLEPVRYRPCPVCRTLMNRVNFSERSGVIIDACRGHGTWFDRDELRRIVEFIRAGGLEASRARDLQRWEMEKRRKATSRPPAGIELEREIHFPEGQTILSDLVHFIGRRFFDHLK